MADDATRSPDTGRPGDDPAIEAAEAEAAEAEALAVAARARAKALRLRLAAEAAKSDSEDAADADGDTAADADGGPGRSRVRLLLTAAVVIVIGVLGALTGIMIWQHRAATRDRQHRAEFEAAARQGVINMTTLDFRNAQSDFQRFLESSTGALRDDLQRQADDFITTLQQGQVVTAGTVTATAVESVADDSAVVLVAARETVQNTAGADQPPRAFRFSVTMARDGDRIKMEKVEFVP